MGLNRDHFAEFSAVQKLRGEFEADWCTHRKVAPALVREWFRRDSGRYAHPEIENAWDGYRLGRAAK